MSVPELASGAQTRPTVRLVARGASTATVETRIGGRIVGHLTASRWRPQRRWKARDPATALMYNACLRGIRKSMAAFARRGVDPSTVSLWHVAVVDVAHDLRGQGIGLALYGGMLLHLQEEGPAILTAEVCRPSQGAATSPDALRVWNRLARRYVGGPYAVSPYSRQWPDTKGRGARRKKPVVWIETDFVGGGECLRNPANARALARRMKGGWPEGLPPIFVLEGEGLVLDGNHRQEAAEIAGLAEIPAVIVPYKGWARLVYDQGWPRDEAIEKLTGWPYPMSWRQEGWGARSTSAPWLSATPSPALDVAVQHAASGVRRRLQAAKADLDSCHMNATLWALALRAAGFRGDLVLDGVFEDAAGGVGHDWVEVQDAGQVVIVDGVYRQFERDPEPELYTPGSRISFKEVTPAVLQKIGCGAVGRGRAGRAEWVPLLDLVGRGMRGRRNLGKRLAFVGRQAGGSVPPAFVSWLGTAFGFDSASPPATLGMADKLVPWLYREWSRRGRLDSSKVVLIRDWWTSERVDLGRLSFAEANRAQAAWHRRLVKERERAIVAFSRRGELALALPDGSSWHVVREGSDKTALAACRAAGRSLGHCYAKAPTLRHYLARGDLYTLYDPGGEPHATLHMIDDVVLEWRVPELVPERMDAVEELHGTGNQPVRGSSRWAAHIRAFLRSRPYPVIWGTPAAHLAEPEDLERWMRSPSLRVEMANYAENRDVLRRLYKEDTSAAVRSGLLQNPYTEARVKKEVLRHGPALPEEVLLDAMALTKSKGVLRALDEALRRAGVGGTS